MTVYLAALASSLHVLSISTGLGAFFFRARFLRQPLDDAGLGRVFAADNVAGIAALFLVGSGLWRAFGGMEKASTFYTSNGMFWVKMGLFAAMFTLECVPMVTLIRWRIAKKKGRQPDVSRARVLARCTDVELAIALLIILVAPLMVRGVWLLA